MRAVAQPGPADQPPGESVPFEWWRSMRLRLLVSAMVILAAAVIGYKELLRLNLLPLQASQTEVAETAFGDISREIGDVRRTTRLLKQSLAVRTALNREAPVGTGLLTRQMVLFSEISPLISQMRWIDAQGRERVRINVDTDRHITIVPKTGLQSKRDRYYFREAMQLSGQQVYLSPLDLNVEHGKIVQPLEPTLRAAIRTGAEDGLHEGILIVNFNLSSLFARLRALAPKGMHIKLLNERGYWLLHPNPEMEWGWQFAGREQVTMPLQHPARWQDIVRGGAAMGKMIGNEIQSHAHIPLLSSPVRDRIGLDRQLILLIDTDEGIAPRIRNTTLAGVGIAALLLFAIVFAVTSRLARGEHQRRQLTAVLKKDKAMLAETNAELETLLEQTHLLQDELVESRKLSSLGMMVAGVAHELNTPIGGALMTISALQGERQSIERAMQKGMTRSELEHFLQQCTEGFELVKHNLGRSAEMIRSFKRLAIDRADESAIEFPLAERVDDLLRSMHPRLKSGRVRITTSIPQNLRIHSYPGVLSQVLQNLIDNAMSHGIGEGKEGNIRISAGMEKANRELRIEVADDGGGIDPEVVDRIYDPFVTSGRGRGHTGLGMHLVHQWVHQVLGGRIKFRSRPGDGTVFVLQIPVGAPGKAVPGSAAA